MASMVTVNCKRCNSPFEARLADRNRGWARFCSKSCKAQHQTSRTGIAGPHYKASGRTVKQMAKGKFAKSKFPGAHTSLSGKHCSACGEPAVAGFRTITGGIDWQCDFHFDDSHPFDSEAAGFNNE